MKANPLIVTCWLLSAMAAQAEQIGVNSEHLEMDDPSTAAYLKCVNQHVDDLLPSIGDIIPLNAAATRGFSACKDAASIVSRRHGEHYFSVLKVVTFQDIEKRWIDARDRLGLPISDLPSK
jgi:hypothetical protein